MAKGSVHSKRRRVSVVQYELWHVEVWFVPLRHPVRRQEAIHYLKAEARHKGNKDGTAYLALLAGQADTAYTGSAENESGKQDSLYNSTDTSKDTMRAIRPMSN